MTRTRQSAIGLTLAAAILIAWAGLHAYGVFLHDWSEGGVLVAPVLIALQTWLSVGLFIVAHDAFHGSLAPGRPLVNRVVGGVCLLIYAGFWFDRLLPKHHAHHASPGTADDPDFHAERPGAFWPWYARFFRQYFGWRELAWVSLVSALYILVLGAELANVWLFWAAPALLSSLQLFAFGTWLPHRAGEDFPDHHRARSSRHPAWLSLLTCFHFGGFHHEHHTHPHLPWWRLPEARRGSTGLPAPVRDAA